MSELDEALYQFDVMVGELRVPDNSNLQIIVGAARKYAAAQRAFQGAQGKYRDGTVESWLQGVADALGFDFPGLPGDPT